MGFERFFESGNKSIFGYFGGKMKWFLFYTSHMVLMFSVVKGLKAQEQLLSDCFNALTVSFPIDNESFSSFHLAPDNAPVVHYLFEDQFTFWYQISAEVSGDLEFTISSSASSDVFQALLYEYNDSLFCHELVSGELDPMKLRQTDFSTYIGADTVQSWQNRVQLEATKTYYLSVLSLVGDHCGHRMSFSFGNERIHLHAMNKPCYHLTALDFDSPVEPEVVDISLPELWLELPSSLTDTSRLNIYTESSPEKNTPHKADQLDKMVVADPVLKPKEKHRTISAPESAIANLDIKAGVKLNLTQVFFHNNTYAFRSDSHQQLDELAALLLGNHEVTIEISGHTSGDTKSIKPDSYNRGRGKGWDFRGSARKLSRKRAEAVKEYLVDKGISSRRLSTVGRGNDQRIIKNPRTPDEHRQNMRVEIEIISAE